MRNGFHIYTDDATKWTVECLLNELVVERVFPRKHTQFKEVLDWVLTHSAVLYEHALPDIETLGSEYLEQLNSDAPRYARLVSGEILVHVIRMAANRCAKTSREITVESVRPYISPYITTTGIKRALEVGRNNGIFIKIGKDMYRLNSTARSAEWINHDALYPCRDTPEYFK